MLELEDSFDFLDSGSSEHSFECDSCLDADFEPDDVSLESCELIRRLEPIKATLFVPSLSLFGVKLPDADTTLSRLSSLWLSLRSFLGSLDPSSFFDLLCEDGLDSFDDDDDDKDGLSFFVLLAPDESFLMTFGVGTVDGDANDVGVDVGDELFSFMTTAAASCDSRTLAPLFFPLSFPLPLELLSLLACLE